MDTKNAKWALLAVAVVLFGAITIYWAIGSASHTVRTNINLNAMRASGTVNNIEYGPCKSMRLEDVCEVAENGIRIRVTAPIDVNVIRTEHRDGILVIKFTGMPAGTCKRWITVPRNVLDGASEIIVKIGLSEMGRFAVNGSTCTKK